MRGVFLWALGVAAVLLWAAWSGESAMRHCEQSHSHLTCEVELR